MGDTLRTGGLQNTSVFLSKASLHRYGRDGAYVNLHFVIHEIPLPLYLSSPPPLSLSSSPPLAPSFSLSQTPTHIERNIYIRAA